MYQVAFPRCPPINFQSFPSQNLLAPQRKTRLYKNTSLERGLASAQHQLEEFLLYKFHGKAVPGSHAWALNAAGLILIGVFERIHQHIIVGVVYAKVPTTNGVQEQGTNTMKSKEPPIH